MALSYEIVSPERLLASAEATSVSIPGTDGDFEVLEMHAPLMSTIRPGVITIRAAGGDERFFVKGGLAQVAPEGLTILAEETIDLNGVTADEIAGKIANAREDLGQAQDDVEKARLSAEIEWMTALEAAL